MRSLTTKLMLGFLAVSLTSVILVAVLAGRMTQTEFDRFVANRSQIEMVDRAADYYLQRGSWDEFELFWQRGRRGGGRNPADVPVGLSDADGQPLIVLALDAGGPGRMDRPSEIHDLPIEVDGEVVGYLQFAAGPERIQPLASPELAFLDGLRRSIIVSGIIATGLALLLGGVLAGTISRPVGELTAATRQLAQGKLGEQVPVRGEDELSELARSFNTMSADLAESSHSRKQMTADIAHDLRTPLSVILGYTEALSDGKLSGSEDVYGAMHQQARHLNRLVDDLRTLSLADAGQLSLNRLPLNPCVLLEHVLLAYVAQAEERGVGLTVDCPANLPDIQVDPDRMLQVLHNLVGNALRHTPEGGQIELSTEAQGQEVRITVHDNGEGITAEALQHVFDRFYRADQARSENGASGLGLAIARSLVGLHDGRISVESIPGQGTSFHIDLPVAAAQA